MPIESFRVVNISNDALIKVMNFFIVTKTSLGRSVRKQFVPIYVSDMLAT